jgi:hypothetical protein
MRIGHALRGPGIFAPPAIHDEAIFILAGPEHQADNPFPSARIYQRRRLRAPAIEIAGHPYFPGFRIEIRENNFLFLQRGKPLQNGLNLRLWNDLLGGAPRCPFGFWPGFDSFKAATPKNRRGSFAFLSHLGIFHFYPIFVLLMAALARLYAAESISSNRCLNMEINHLI